MESGCRRGSRGCLIRVGMLFSPFLFPFPPCISLPLLPYGKIERKANGEQYDFLPELQVHFPHYGAGDVQGEVWRRGAVLRGEEELQDGG